MRFKEYYKSQRSILEYTTSELISMSDGGRKSRTKSVKRAIYKRTTKAKDGHLKTIWSVPSVKNSKKRYKQVLEIIPKEMNAFSLINNDVSWDLKHFSSILKSSDARVYCSCPDFLFGGQKYNVGDKGDYSGALAKGNIGNFFSGDKADVTIAPNIKDPDREHVLCKHLIKVLKVFPANISSIMKDAKSVL